MRIDDVKFAEPKFAQGANDFDVCVRVVAIDDPAQADWWRGEVSENYGKGNFQDMKQSEITLMTLRRVGFEGDDLTTLARQIVGTETTATIKAREYDGKTYYDVSYIGEAAGQMREIDLSEMQARLQAHIGGNDADSDATDQAPRPTAKAAKSTGTKSNPFAK